MKNKWKIHRSPTTAITATVVETASLSSAGVANGRNIPVVILQSDSNQLIDKIIAAHSGIPNGICESQWGATLDKNKILLDLEFTTPQKIRIIIPFDVINHGLTINQIVYTQCMYLMTGTTRSKLSENLDKEKVLMEIPSKEFMRAWQYLYKKKYCKYLQKKHNISHKVAVEIFDKMQEELCIFQKMRMH